MSPNILEILIIQNGGKVAAGKQTSPRQEQKMANRIDASSVQTSPSRPFSLGETKIKGLCDVGRGNFISVSLPVLKGTFLVTVSL